MELSLNSLSPLNTNTSKAIVIGSACKIAEVDRNTMISFTSPDNHMRDHSRIGTPAVKEGIFSPSRGKISSFTKWTGNIEPLDTSVHRSAIQERNSGLSCIEKVGVKTLPDKIVADLEPSIRVNLANSVFSESPKFKNLRLTTFHATDVHNIDFAPSTRAKSLNGTQRENFRDTRMGYTHDFEIIGKTTAYSNHTNNSELETREVFERETENIPHTRQTDLVTTLHDNPLTRSTDSSKMKKGTNRR